MQGIRHGNHHAGGAFRRTAGGAGHAGGGRRQPDFEASARGVAFSSGEIHAHGRKLAVKRTETEQIRKRELYEVELTVEARVEADDEAWLESFSRAFIVNLPRGGNDALGNWVRVRVQKGTFWRAPDQRLGEGVIKVFTRVNPGVRADLYRTDHQGGTGGADTFPYHHRNNEIRRPVWLRKRRRRKKRTNSGPPRRRRKRRKFMSSRRRRLWKRRKRPLIPEKDVATQAPALESLSALADRHRVPSWQQAALCRFMGWAEGKLVSDAEYRDALENLKRRRLCGGRAR